VENILGNSRGMTSMMSWTGTQEKLEIRTLTPHVQRELCPASCRGQRCNNPCNVLTQEGHKLRAT
jgi:hypothetical protein